MTQLILDYLNQFTTSDQLRDECVRLGITGVPGHCYRCVAAKLVRRILGCECEIFPCLNPITNDIELHIGNQLEQVPLPAHVNAFVAACNRGDYPELVEDSPDEEE